LCCELPSKQLLPFVFVIQGCISEYADLRVFRSVGPIKLHMSPAYPPVHSPTNVNRPMKPRYSLHKSHFEERNHALTSWQGYLWRRRCQDGTASFFFKLTAIPVRTLPPSPAFPVKNWSNPETSVLELGVVNFLDSFQIPQVLRDSVQDFPVPGTVEEQDF